MSDHKHLVRTFILHHDVEAARNLAKQMSEKADIRIIGVSSDVDADAYRIIEAEPEAIVADVDAEGMKFLTENRTSTGDCKIVFLAPRSEEGCNCCYEALKQGAHAIHCRPASSEDYEHCEQLLESVANEVAAHPEDCPALLRLRSEQEGNA